MVRRSVLFGEVFDALLAAAQTGSGWAWDRLFTSLAPAVAGYLRVQGAHDVNDLTSEVFVSVFRNIGSFEGREDNFRSWVFVIAHRRLTDQRRIAARRPSIHSFAELPDSCGVSDDLTASATAGVLGLLDRLSPDQRDVLALRIVADLTIEQIATSLGKSVEAVKALQRRGLDAIRRIISREGIPL